jgi:hypothetical protein
MPRRLVAAGLLASLAAGCGAPGEDRAEPEQVGERPSAPRWSLEPLWTSSDTLLLSGVFGMAADSRGRLYTFDRDIGLILFSEDGRAIRRIGRKGEGPGEYAYLSGLQVIAGDTLLAWDGQLRRLTVFEPDSGRFAFDRALFQGGGESSGVTFPPRRLHRLRGEPERYLATFPPWMSRDREQRGESWVVRFIDGRGTVLRDSLLSFPPAESVEIGDESRFMVLQHPLAPQTLVEFGPDDRLYYARTDTARIRILDLKGREVGGFSFQRRSRPVTDEDVEAWVEMMTDDRSDFGDMAERVAAGFRDLAPERHPLFMRFVVDDRGRVWIPPQHSEPEPEPPFEWEIYSPDGRLLGILPVDQGIREIRGDRVYGIARDSMGVPTIWAAVIRERDAESAEERP